MGSIYFMAPEQFERAHLDQPAQLVATDLIRAKGDLANAPLFPYNHARITRHLELVPHAYFGQLLLRCWREGNISNIDPE